MHQRKDTLPMNKFERQRGFVSQMLVFIILILMANAAIFAPNIATLKKGSDAHHEQEAAKMLSLVASSVAKHSRDADEDGTIEPPAAFSTQNQVLVSGIAANSVGGLLPTGLNNISNYHDLRYCPYDRGDDFDAAGYVITEGEDGEIVFSIIAQGEEEITCEQALTGNLSEDAVINVTYAMAATLLRSAQAEITPLPEDGCAAGEDMSFKTSGTPEEQGDFECDKNVMDFVVKDPEAEICPTVSAISRKEGENGLHCANVTARETGMAGVTRDTSFGGGNKYISLQNMVDFFDVANVAPSDSQPANIPGLSGFTCNPPIYNEVIGASSVNQVVVYTKLGDLFCVTGTYGLVIKGNGARACPEGKRVILRDHPDGKTMICEDSPPNDPNFGQFKICSGASDIFGYSPEVKRAQCFNTSFSVPTVQDYIYAEKGSDDCTTDGVAYMSNNIGDCSKLYAERLEENITALSGYLTTDRFNWNPATKKLTRVILPVANPGVGIGAGEDEEEDEGTIEGEPIEGSEEMP